MTKKLETVNFPHKLVIHQLFPIPVYVSKLGRQLTEEESKTINKCKKKTHLNQGNIISEDTYVLENKTLKHLKEDLNEKVVDYFEKIIGSDNPIAPYITQSWLNYTKANQYHHQHFHSNSYVSGVFYLNADPKVDHIKFYRSHFPEIEPLVTKYNIFNAKSLWFPVETGNVVLFPSSLSHGVDKKIGANTRVSLSFNTYFKGTIGSQADLTELVLK